MNWFIEMNQQHFKDEMYYIQYKQNTTFAPIFILDESTLVAECQSKYSNFILSFIIHLFFNVSI